MAPTVESSLDTLHYVYPLTIFAYFGISCLITTWAVQALTKFAAPSTSRSFVRRVVAVLSLFLLTYLVQLGKLCVRSLSVEGLATQEHIIVGYLSCVLVFGIQLSQLLDTEDPVWFPYYSTWLLALAFEGTIGGLEVAQFIQRRPLFIAFDYLDVICIGLRCIFLLALPISIFIRRYIVKKPDSMDEERQPLLYKDNAAPVTTKDPLQRWKNRQNRARESMAQRFQEGGSWLEYAKGYKILFPYIWPTGNRRLQVRAFAVLFCLFASNGLHLLIPRQTGIIMDSLSGASQRNPWPELAVFLILRLIASESGLELLRQWLWVPVKYNSQSTLVQAAYSHIMYLSADFHDSKHTSDMVMAIQGGSAVSDLVETVFLQAGPMLIDMLIAVAYLSWTFGPAEGLLTVATGSIFIIYAGRLINYTRSSSEERIRCQYVEHNLRFAGFTGWRTVSEFNQIGYEDNRHSDAVTQRWLKEHEFIIGWQIAVALQTLVLTSGLLASAALAVYRIRSGYTTSGQFVMLLMYWSQLTSPLQFFSSLGKDISDSFIGAELLLETMNIQPTVQSKKGARPLKLSGGQVEFDGVSFGYDQTKTILKDMSFSVPAGQTVAFVGATGAGKSTILKLLNRFYDIQAGSLRIDGQDVRDVELFSLRDRIGVVPQSPVLFDDTVMNNVRYGKITATDEEVFEACRAACVHDNIKNFSQGYDTYVGERGMKLSGGEVQRIAIARAMLKNPDIVTLDEATSAVDTDTEQQIQRSLKELCKGRTTLVIAHRLSTIMNADRIMVVEHGEIIEQGTHEDLITANGRYAELWSKQSFVQKKPQSEISKDGFMNDLPETQSSLDDSKTISSDCSVVAAIPQDAGSSEPAVSTSEHKKEGSQLNPDAPAFTPSYVYRRPAGRDASTGSEYSGTKGTGATTPHTSRQWSDEISAEDEVVTTGQMGPLEDKTKAARDSQNGLVGEVEKRIAFVDAVDRVLAHPQDSRGVQRQIGEQARNNSSNSND